MSALIRLSSKYNFKLTCFMPQIEMKYTDESAASVKFAIYFVLVILYVKLINHRKALIKDL